MPTGYTIISVTNLALRSKATARPAAPGRGTHACHFATITTTVVHRVLTDFTPCKRFGNICIHPGLATGRSRLHPNNWTKPRVHPWPIGITVVFPIAASLKGCLAIVITTVICPANINDRVSPFSYFKASSPPDSGVLTTVLIIGYGSDLRCVLTENNQYVLPVCIMFATKAVTIILVTIEDPIHKSNLPSALKRFPI